MSRFADDSRFAPPMVVTGAQLVEHVDGALGDRGSAQIIVEPEAKNTAAAIALAANLLEPEAVMLVCPSDHHIQDSEAFIDAAFEAADLAREGWLVALAVGPTSPATGFGYIRLGRGIGERGFQAADFVEKPDEATARSLLGSGEYLWNAGIFVFRAGDFLHELELLRPALASAVRESIVHGRAEGRYFHPEWSAFSEIEAESVDYAVFENSARAAAVPVAMTWSDIGTWDAVHQARPRDESGNSASGPARLVDCNNVLVDTDGPRVLAIGLEDIIVVVDGNDIVVTTASHAHRVGDLSLEMTTIPDLTACG